MKVRYFDRIHAKGVVEIEVNAKVAHFIKNEREKQYLLENFFIFFKKFNCIHKNYGQYCLKSQRNGKYSYGSNIMFLYKSFLYLC